jgi:hypothetical protein
MRGKRKNARRSHAASRRTHASAKTAANRISPARRSSNKKIRGVPVLVDMVTFEPQGLGARTAGQSGDLQGLSGVEAAGSESVQELLEEGNAFEADIVKGVEDAENADEIEVETHEVPEDDVPQEYLDQR